MCAIGLVVTVLALSLCATNVYAFPGWQELRASHSDADDPFFGR